MLILFRYFFQFYFPLALFCPFYMHGQGGFKKFHRAPNSTFNFAKDVIETPTGNLIVAGITADSTYGQRLSLLGLNSSGNEIWRKNYGNPNFLYLDYSELSRAPMLKDNSGFYQTITVWDTINDYYSVLLRFDFTGDTLWQKKYISLVPNEYFYVHNVSHSVDGGLILSGTVADMNNGTENALIIKTDLQGNVIWQKNLLSPIITPVAVWRINRSVQDSSTKKIVSVGWQYDSNWQATALLLITDSLGNPIYSTSFSGIYGGHFGDLIQAKDGNFIAVGAEGAPVVYGTTRASWLRLFKFNINGSVLWSKKYFNPSRYNTINTINETNTGDLILGANMDTLSYSTSNTSLNAFNRIFKTDQNGNVLSYRDFDFTNYNVNDIVRSVNLGSNGSIFAVVELPMSVVSPYILIKMDSTGCDSTPIYCTDPVGLIEIYEKTGFSFEMYPNPANEKVHFRVNANIENIFEIQLSDLQGRELERFELGTEKELELNTASYSQGVYLVRIYLEGRAIEAKKIMIAR